MRASTHQPVLIVLDNLHWAHPSSLLLLNFLATSIVDQRILIVGTYRNEDITRGHPLIHALGDLNRLDHFDRLILRGLTSNDIADYIFETCGVHAHGRLAELIHLHTEGNSFFVTELVRLLYQEGVLHGNAGEAETLLRERVPAGVREVIGRRLDRVSEASSRVLTIGSVMGREFSLEQLLALPAVTFDEMGLPGDSAQIMDALDEAIASALIEEVDHGAGKFRFGHALIQQALAAELSTTLKIRLHARIAETLEGMQGNGVGARLGELVRHYSEAEALVGSDKLIKYLILAGEQALSTYAYEEALEFFRRALEAQGTSEPDGRLASILFGLGRAQVATAQRHEMQNAVETLTRAFDHYEKAGDVETALQVAEYPVMATTGITGITHLISRALELAGPDSHRSGRLWGRYIRAAALERGDYEQANGAYLRAVEIARRERGHGSGGARLRRCRQRRRILLGIDTWPREMPSRNRTRSTCSQARSGVHSPQLGCHHPPRYRAACAGASLCRGVSRQCGKAAGRLPDRRGYRQPRRPCATRRRLGLGSRVERLRTPHHSA